MSEPIANEVPNLRLWAGCTDAEIDRAAMGDRECLIR